MVIYSDTLIPCHKLTSKGKENYLNLLEKVADLILEDQQHPIKAFFRKLFDSTPWLS